MQLVSCKSLLSVISCDHVNEGEFRVDLGRRMQQARIATWGPVRRACATATGIPASQISRWEAGQTLPRLYELVRFASACNTTVEDLLGRKPHPLADQLLLGLDAEAKAVVVDLVEYLRERRPRKVASTRRTG